MTISTTMAPCTIRDATPDDFPTIMAINAVEVQQTSPMDLKRLNQLHHMSSYHKVAILDSQITAFLLTIPQNQPYDNDNYGSFSKRLDQFLYIDRIVVGAAFKGMKIGISLYQALFAWGRNQGYHAIVCEYNLQPPNPASQRFHDRFGFAELGTQWIAAGSKLVSLQIARL